MSNLLRIVASFEAVFSQEIEKIGNTVPRKLYEPIAYSLSIGGKRLRPALMLQAASMFATSVDHVMPAAMAIEIFHNFTLLHDDIMDKADVRRGLPTVHKKYNKNVAILSGDAMSILAFRYFARGNDERLHELLPLFTTTALEVCEGQQFDMDFESRDNVTVDEYLEMIRLKTAVLIAGSLKIGALLANASPHDADLLYEYGINVGLAFQLQDDWLDTFGDPGSFGKVIGGDICSNKKTYLLLKAREAADASMRQELAGWLKQTDFNREQKVAAITAIYHKTGVSEAARSLMKHYHEKALASLRELNLPDEQKSTLYTFAGEVMERIK